MNEVEVILGKNNTKNNYSNNRNFSTNSQNYNRNNQNRNNYREQQNRERQAIFDSMNRMSTIVGNDGKKYQEYLDIQSKFPKHSVGNCLVILEKFPQATQIKDKNSWNEKGIELVEGAKSIKILEPYKSENNRTYFNPKDVYDISQTNAEKPKEIYLGDKKLLEAILYECDVPREAVDKLPDGTMGTEYNQEKNILYVCKGMNRELLFQTLSQAMADIEMKDIENSDIKNFRSYCVSYMFCKNYGIDVSNYDFSNLPNELTNPSEEKGIRFQLEQIRSNYEKINNRMTDYFEQSSKTKNKSVPER